MDKRKLYQWCAVPSEELMGHPARKVPLRIVKDAKELGEVMARDFVEDIKLANQEGREYKAIVPCGPKEWYAPFARMVNEEQVSLRKVTVFHMNENLDWEGKMLHLEDPSNFQTFMRRYFYGPVREELAVPEEQRFFLTPENYRQISDRILNTEIDYTLGGWGQDGHVAFNQARRDPYSTVSLEELRESTARIQNNNADTILALAHRSFGAAWQFMPPMSLTLGIKECFRAKKIRVYSATGAWKQTALRVALFSETTPEYPMTLLQEHPDARITATQETADHPVSHHPEWKIRGVNV